MTKAEVDVWMANYDSLQKDLMQDVRAAILAADARVSEGIKWQAPTFTYKGNIASFFPKAKAHVSLMFHQGASIPDLARVLEGDGAEARTFKVRDAAEFAAKLSGLQDVIRAWCDMKDGK